MKQLLSSAQHRTCNWSVVVIKYLAKHNVMAGASAIFPRLVTAHFLPLSRTTKCSGRTIHELRPNHSTNNESTDRGIEKRFPGMLPRALQMLAKVCHCPMEPL
jgi:hypothetical protein